MYLATELQDELQSYQSDHLLLLVGANPLPNAVAARLLVKPRGTAHLLRSAATDRVADRLQTWLTGRGVSCVTVERKIDEADPVAVEQSVHDWAGAVRDWARPRGQTDFGLHYTGGTKVMAVHAHRAVNAALTAGDRRPICSYLDPATLSLCFDAADPASGQRDTIVRVGRRMQLAVDDILVLHGAAPRGTVPATSLVDATLDALSTLDPSLPEAAVRAGVRVQGGAIFDVLAVCGYQVFAFVCSEDTERAVLKRALFACHERARRVGGDEARVALVCRFHDPARLQQEMSTDFDFAPGVPGYREQFKVFGNRHLEQLSSHVRRWFAQEMH